VQPESEDDLKKLQLMELAIMNGTYRGAEGNFFPFVAAAAAAAAVSRTSCSFLLILCCKLSMSYLFVSLLVGYSRPRYVTSSY